MKKFISFMLLAVSFSISAQVGIDTTTPAATLDITAKTPTGAVSTVDGLLIPRVDRLRAQSMTGVTTSTLIYVDNIATGTATLTAVQIDSTGFYFFNGSIWQKISTANNTFVPAVVLSARSTTTQNVGPAANLNMLFPTADINDGNYNTTTGVYTVPAGGGTYLVTVKAKHDVNSAANSFGVRINAGTQSSNIIQVNSQADAFPDSRSGSATFRLAAGDTISVSIQTCSGGCTTTIYAVSEATMAIQKVAP
ncbi:hypothetical protein J3D55_000740 [Chryseobacterium ginsenosidimutans]|uniref:hypothetical protein n=1 Tax=Chryseobacterium ginsenosidimutans TaxID=687846 RepID=UPI00216A3577|nr:hypothetical protein [Chryseobacterium ginsenosidimutans]MCS3867824.1 hypothetical protein [Chryseobacterium ginsenosidimutans]